MSDDKTKRGRLDRCYVNPSRRRCPACRNPPVQRPESAAVQNSLESPGLVYIIGHTATLPPLFEFPTFRSIVSLLSRANRKGQHGERDYFAGGFQLERSVMGEAVASPVGTLIKKRPSAETAYWCLLVMKVPSPTMPA